MSKIPKRHPFKKNKSNENQFGTNVPNIIIDEVLTSASSFIPVDDESCSKKPSFLEYCTSNAWYWNKKGHQKTPGFDEIQTGHFESTIIQQWSWLLRLQLLYGSFPFSMSHPEYGQNFKFALCSTITLGTICIASVRLSICLWQFYDWGEFMLGRAYEDSVEDWIVLSTNYIIPVLQLWDTLCIWLVLGKTGKFFNGLVRFENQFLETFTNQRPKNDVNPEKYPTTIGRWGLMLFLLSIGSNIGMTLYFWFVLLQKKQNCPIYAHIGFVFVKIIAMVVSNGEEIKKVLMYRVLSEGFRNVRRKIQIRLDNMSIVEPGSLPYEIVNPLDTCGGKSSVSIPDGPLSTYEICKLRKLLIQLKSLVKLAGEIQSPHELIVLIHTVVIYTESLFILVKALLTQEFTNAVMLFGVLSWAILVKLIIKTIWAQQIPDQESRIAEILIDVNSTAVQDVVANIELRKVIDLIRSSPAKISLSGFVVIDKKLLPKVSSYVVAYLVVLAQFYLSSRREIECTATRHDPDNDSSFVFENGRNGTNNTF